MPEAAERPTGPKRRVKSPETFRQKALKAAEDSEKPSRKHLVRKGFGDAAKLTAQPFRRPYRSARKTRVARWLRRPIRLLGKVFVPVYFRRSWQELRLVTWPTPKVSRQLTWAVLVFAIVFGVAIALVDYGLDKIFRQILLK